MIETQRSMMDVCEIGLSNIGQPAGPVTYETRPTSLGPLSFVDGPVHSMTDSEMESQRLRAFQSQGVQDHALEEDILEVKEKSG